MSDPTTARASFEKAAAAVGRLLAVPVDERTPKQMAAALTDAVTAVKDARATFDAIAATVTSGGSPIAIAGTSVIVAPVLLPVPPAADVATIAARPGISAGVAGALTSGHQFAGAEALSEADPSNLADIAAINETFYGGSADPLAISLAICTARLLGADPATTLTALDGSVHHGTGNHAGTYVQPVYKDPEGLNGPPDYTIVTPGYWSEPNPALGDTGGPSVP